MILEAVSIWDNFECPYIVKKKADQVIQGVSPNSENVEWQAIEAVLSAQLTQGGTLTYSTNSEKASEV